MKQTCYVKTDSPIGQLFLITDQISIISLEFFAVQASIPVLTENLPLMKEALAELQAYFSGTLRQFSVPLNPTGTTFQRSVWEWTQAVPYGETVSYGDLARGLNRPRAYRAVAHALSRNPLPIFIPCHRVIRSNGSLGGYSSGLNIKKNLLILEHRSAMLPRVIR